MYLTLHQFQSNIDCIYLNECIYINLMVIKPGWHQLSGGLRKVNGTVRVLGAQCVCRVCGSMQTRQTRVPADAESLNHSSVIQLLIR